MKFTDGTYLSELGARDQHDTPFSPEGQGAGKILYPNQWNSSRSTWAGSPSARPSTRSCSGTTTPRARRHALPGLGRRHRAHREPRDDRRVEPDELRRHAPRHVRDRRFLAR
ncbi:hypothetical protein NKG05_09650 [Oerskovia sp. M15]